MIYSEQSTLRATAAATQTAKTRRKRNLQDATSPLPKCVKAPAANPPLKKHGHGVESSTSTPTLNAVPTSRLEVYVFGDGSDGQFGLGSNDAVEVERPRLNHSLDPESVGVVSLAAGGMHAAALTHNNQIPTWGVNDHGALGRYTNQDPDSESEPTAIPADKFPAGTRLVQVAAGDSATFALK